MVFSSDVSKAARMIRLLTHWTMGGVRMIRSQSSMVVSSNFSDSTR